MMRRSAVYVVFLILAAMALALMPLPPEAHETDVLVVEAVVTQRCDFNADTRAP